MVDSRADKSCSGEFRRRVVLHVHACFILGDIFLALTLTSHFSTNLCRGTVTCETRKIVLLNLIHTLIIVTYI